MQAARVSVALCTYNGAAFIDEQLASIAAQGDLVAEIVVADDGSSDDTLRRVRAFGQALLESGSPIELRLLDGPGGHGVTKNFERAVSACRHELIALSDQDDRWLPGRLALQLQEFDARPELLLLSADARLVDATGRPLGATLLQTLEVTADTRSALAEDPFGTLLRRNLVTGATVVFRRDLLPLALPFPREWVHDEWLAMMAAVRGEIALLEQPVVDYRQHGNNQIGVKPPTLANKLRRVLQPRGERNRQLAERAAILADRLADAGLDGPRQAAVQRAAAQKAAFERARADLPPARWRRLPGVLGLLRTGDYRRYASQGTTDVLRDLFQPA
ncbi:glycosyltransferase family 2 protein [Microterricola viridarii]|uniref:Glycosyltransferase involved in cell wall bisynthesis n=1 Tax=Microterricola viridarii TaxID=412690 RepID=A0A1H1QYV4_9MICO|nr:glycosyltransferase family 2 protein [Microterricola viridarii]SDS28425.1 Glycosyltransferase involved in cell wall bisynthesis [Microterricola viridarii]